MQVVYVIKSFQNAVKRNKLCYWREEQATEEWHRLPSRQVIELGLQHTASLMRNSHWALFASCKKIKAVIHAEESESARLTP